MYPTTGSFRHSVAEIGRPQLLQIFTCRASKTRLAPHSRLRRARTRDVRCYPTLLGGEPR